MKVPMGPTIVLILSCSLGTSLSSEYTIVDFGNTLDKFKDCMVHVVLNDFEGDEKLAVVKPFGFPSVLSRRRYKMISTNGNKGGQTLHPDAYELESNNAFLFQTTPSPKLTCFVQIFVHPISGWDQKQAFHYLFYQIDLSTFSQMLIYRESTHFMDLRKCCTFLIHVESAHTQSTEYRQVQSHYIERESTPDIINSAQLNYLKPTKLFFWIKYLEERQSFVVESEAVSTCTESNELVKWIYQNCQAKLKTNEEMYICAFATNLKEFEKRIAQTQRRFVKYSGDVDNREVFQKIRLTCLNYVIHYVGKLDQMVVMDTYFDKWKKTGNDIAPILLRMMLPNSTILNSVANEIFASFSSNFLIRDTINPTVWSNDQDSLHFITCVPISNPSFLSLIGYISAFSLSTWQVFALCLILSTFAWHYVSTKTNGPKYSVVGAISLFYNVLVAQSTSTINTCRWLTGAWVVAGMFLTNNYQGNNIDQLTSPLVPTKMETFEEIFSNNLTVYSLPLDSAEHEVIASYFTHADPEQFDPKGTKMWEAYELRISQTFLRKQINMTDDDAIKHLERLVKIPINFRESLEMLPFEYYVKQMSKCGPDVFVDKLVEVNRLQSALSRLEYVQYENIATSKTSYGMLYQAFESNYYEIPVEYYETRYLSLIQSGIAKLWQDWKYRVDSGNDKSRLTSLHKETPFKSLSMDSNVAVVFYVHFLLLAISVPVFLYECSKYFRRQIIQIQSFAGLLATRMLTTCVSIVLAGLTRCYQVIV